MLMWLGAFQILDKIASPLAIVARRNPQSPARNLDTALRDVDTGSDELSDVIGHSADTNSSETPMREANAKQQKHTEDRNDR